ncbi:MAG: AAA family ATPase [Chloroflexi bacterium]|nr:AAA family ATPase [Chloroflexota bacterium]
MRRAPSYPVLPGNLPTRSALVGREGELSFLRGQFDAVANGDGGRIVFVTGPAGVGKTRLARETTEYAVDRGGQVLEGAYFRDGVAPYGPWIDALRPALSRIGADELADATAPYRVELSQLFPELTVPGATAATTVALEEQRRRLVAGLAELVIELSRRDPLVLFLDDLQWAPSFSALTHLGRRLRDARVLVIGAYREEEFQDRPELLRAWAELNRTRLALQLNVRPLGEEETGQLISQYFGERPADELRQPLYRQTRGNPFFLEELVRALAESGAVRPDPDGWSIVDLSRAAIPTSVRLVVEERVARLGELSQEILTMAAVLGQEVGFAVLQTLTGRTEDELLEVIGRAVAARLLVDRSTSAEERYAFADDQVRDVLYAGIVAPRRHRLHLLAGQALETTYAGRLDGRLGELAHHFLEGNDVVKAFEYAVTAGEHALALASWEQASRYFEAARDLLNDVPVAADRRAGVLERLAELDALMGRAGIRHARAALALYTSLGDRRKSARLHRLIGRAWASGAAGRTDLGQYLAESEAAVALLATEPDSAEKALAYGGLANGLILSRLDLEGAHGASAEAVTIAERLADADQIAHAGTYLSTAHAYRGELSDAVAVIDRSWQAAQSAVDHYVKAAALVAPVLWWPWRNDREWLERWLSRYHEYRRESHVERFDRPVAGIVALVAALSGQPEATRKALHSAEESAAQRPADHAISDYLAAAAAGILGDWSQATRLFERALAANQQSGASASLVEAAGHYGRYLLVSWNPKAALPVVTAACALARERRSVVQELNLLPILGELHLRLGHVDEAERAVGRVRELLDRPGEWRGLAAPVYRARGLVAAARCAWPEAEASLASALEAERAYGFPYNEAHILVAWGELCLRRDQRGDRRRGVDLLQRAAALFRQCGAVKDLDLLQLVHTRYQIAGERSGQAPTRRVSPDSLLTKREREVAQLISRGLSNRQIAEELVISEGTARIHVEHILSKLDLRSRVQLATWAIANGLGSPLE